jgi:hypothetical protein
MNDSLPQFEITDQLGGTYTYAGTVDQTGITLPSVADDPIDGVGIRCAIDQPFASRLEFSYDNGSSWFRLAVGEAREDELRGYKTQIKIRAAGPLTTCNYEIIMNRGPK